MKNPERSQKRPIWQRIPWRLLIVITTIAISPHLVPGGSGIGKDQSITTKSVEKDAQGNITKTIETTKNDDGKTLWDWLSVLGVPLTLLVLGYRLQQIQQQRAADETKEEVLQVYFDRLSVLLVDKNLLAMAVKVNPTGTEGQPKNNVMVEDQKLLDSAVDVIRARTLSILRRFENDPERKTSVIRFLIEADIVSKLKLNLSDANLSDANLSRAILNDANLGRAILSKAILSNADLSDADLSFANLSDADLSDANLSDANLSDANLRGANLRGANLSGAKLYFAELNGAELSDAKLINAELISTKNLHRDKLECAKLCHTKLPKGVTLDPNRDCKELGIPEK